MSRPCDFCGQTPPTEPRATLYDQGYAQGHAAGVDASEGAARAVVRAICNWLSREGHDAIGKAIALGEYREDARPTLETLVARERP